VRKSIAERRQAALATAFARRDLAAVRTIYALLPEQARTTSVRIKQTIAQLPRPLCRLGAKITLAFGSLKSILFGSLATQLRSAWR
jgi:hypothetical protein